MKIRMLERSGKPRDNQNMTKIKCPRDTNQLAHVIAQIASGEKTDDKTDDGKDPAAVALGRKGGLKGAPQERHR